MWFLVGLLSLVAITLAVAWWRWGVDWKGEPHGAGRFKLSTYKNKVQSLRVGITAPLALDFELKPEGWFDRFGKSTGLSVESQANLRSFDELVYVVADDERLVRAMRADRQLLGRLEGIGRAHVGGYRFHRLVCRRGQLWLVFKPEAKPEDHLAATQWALGELQALAQALPAPGPGQPHVANRKFLYAFALLAFSIALAINGGVQLFRLLVQRMPYTLDSAQLFTISVACAIALLIALALVTLALLGRSSRAHLVLLQVLLFGGLGGLATCYAEVRDLNMEADTAPARELASVVQKKYVTTSRQRGRDVHTYHLELADWNHAGGSVDLEVNGDTYDLRLVDEALVVRQHPGLLHVRWIESIEPAPRH